MMEFDVDLVSDTPFPANVEGMFGDVLKFIKNHQEVLDEEDTVAKFIELCDEKNYPMALAQQMAYKVLLSISDDRIIDQMLSFNNNPANTVH